jgi:hypothetical protein
MATGTSSRAASRSRSQDVPGGPQGGSGQNLDYYRKPAPGGSGPDGPEGPQGSVSVEAGGYHRYVLAEFVACLAMIAGGMILIADKSTTADGSDTAAASRSYAKELVQLTALCVVFFILALAGSGPKTGKVAAAFGGLVMLGVAWNLSEMWSGLAKALGGQTHTNTPSGTAKAAT